MNDIRNKLYYLFITLAILCLIIPYAIYAFNTGWMYYEFIIKHLMYWIGGAVFSILAIKVHE